MAQHRVVIHVAHELSVESMKREEITLTVPPGVDIKTALKRTSDACLARTKRQTLPCAACKRAGAEAQTTVCIAEEKFPVNMHYYVIPFCDASDVCMKQAKSLMHLLNLLFPDKETNLRACHVCKELERRGGRLFFSCIYCNEVYFCSFACLGKGGERCHQRACPRRPMLPADRFSVEYLGILLLPGDDPGLALVRGPDAMAPGDPTTDATTLKEVPDFKLWFNMERTDRRFTLLQRVPSVWHCACGKACTDMGMEKVAGVAILDKEPHWRLIQILAPTCGDACMNQLHTFISTSSEQIIEQALQRGGTPSCCAGCSLWPPIGKSWQTCDACHVPAYCSRACQVKAWPTHKTWCHPVKERTPRGEM